MNTFDRLVQRKTHSLRAVRFKPQVMRTFKGVEAVGHRPVGHSLAGHRAAALPKSMTQDNT